MVHCPSCSRECADDSRFCSHCAKPLDASSAETEVLGAVLSSQSSVDEGRFLPGTVVAGRYRIAGLLGRGGMGEVYRATDLTLGQAVALKFLPESLSRDDRALARFYNEVRTARQVTHPNVSGFMTSARPRGCTTFPWSSWMARTWARCCAVSGDCPSIRPWRRRKSYARAWRRRMRRACCIAI